MTQEYGKKDYWDERYRNFTGRNTFDWYQNYKNLKEILEARVGYEEKVLIVGTGNSRLPVSMAECGYKDVIAIDFSATVIEKMKQFFPEMDNLRFEVVDVKKMPYKTEEFGAIVDKGTLDAVLCGNNSLDNSTNMINEIYRALKPGGVFIEITYGHPENRLDVLQRRGLDWGLTQMKIRKPVVEGDAPPPEHDAYHFIYIMEKR